MALVGWIWFIAWTASGDALGHWVGDPGTGLVLGFLCALAILPAWPWVLPPNLDDWMHDVPPARLERHHWLPPSLRLHGKDARHSGRDLKRVAIVAAIWFAFWMMLGAVIGGVLSKRGLAIEGVYDGFFNGAWWALLTSFAWPWFMPAAIDRWMYRSQVG